MKLFRVERDEACVCACAKKIGMRVKDAINEYEQGPGVLYGKQSAILLTFAAAFNCLLVESALFSLVPHEPE